MLQDVIINLKTIHDCESEEQDSLDFITDGFYTFDDNVGCISYEETEVTGMQGTRTSVLVMPEQVVVDRDGTVTSRMIFKEGEKSDFLYTTPYGKATMGLRTRKINHNFDENGGLVEIEYDVDVDHTIFTRNKLILDVKTSGETTNA